MKRGSIFGWIIAALVLSARAEPTFHTSPSASVLICGGSMMNGDHFADAVLDVMREHYAGCRKIALVLHATHPTERDRMEARLRTAFDHLGSSVARHAFGQPPVVRPTGGMSAQSLHRLNEAERKTLLKTADGIFVGGGETFVVLAELYRSGELELIRERTLAGIPYGGSSAGANVAGLFIGTTNDFPTAHIPSREALGIFPAVINPHHPLPEARSDFDARSGKIKGFLKFNPTETVLALANASIMRLRHGRLTLMAGNGWVYRAEGMMPLSLGEERVELKLE